MSDLSARVSQLARLIEEFGLEGAALSGRDWKVAMTRESAAPAAAPAAGAPAAAPRPAKRRREDKVAAPVGKPITSPMMGIYYSSPSPGSPAFVKPGDMVNAGDVVGLIEAMKVFNEIVSPFSGTVASAPAENGQLVQPGDTLLLID